MIWWGKEQRNDPPKDWDPNRHPLTGSWICSAIGALVAIPVGIRRKSLGPLVAFGGTGAMLDIVLSVMDYERDKRAYENHVRHTQIQAEGSDSSEAEFEHDTKENLLIEDIRK